MRRERPLSEEPDATIAGLDAPARELVAATSARRAALELEGAAAFAAVTGALVELGADARIVDLAARAVSEEIRHAEIYRELARAYARGSTATAVAEGDEPPRVAPIDVPAHPGVTPREESLLRVVGMCSINETMACSFLELSLAGATAPFARAGVREILEDEIRHARIGWAYLGSPDVGDAERRLVAAWLLPMLRAQWDRWRAQIATLPALEVPAHGCPSPTAIERASVASIRDLVLPGFARAGVDVAAAQAWAAHLG
jgi:hypothetical protein